ncbi:hypothetical protein Sjap_004309 [Stephania japonica]|uniref:Plastid lipid-associated protein/fibrillin conserved domain-containing protein n=1 Tax=Stephania japonica TaxID=461633 RepID=A0AAP0K219_9MAGN
MASSSLPLSNFRGPETLKPSKPSISHPNRSTPPSTLRFPPRSQHRKPMISRTAASVTTQDGVRTSLDDLVVSILSKVSGTDRGVSLSKEEHKEVAAVASKLQNYCVDKPVACPLIFGEWDVMYCSNPTSPGGGYRSAIGRIVFKTKDMIQIVEAPDIVRNRVSFSAFGFLDGEVSLKGKLRALDDKWVQVIFEAPELKVGGLEFKYGGQSEVQLEITYIDEKIRLGKGSRGSLFVFQRRN